MKEIKLKPLLWAALSVILVVLVVSYLAYGVYVPKKQEIESLQAQVTMAKNEQARLRKLPVPKKVTEADKAKLALLVPTDLDQSRFLKGVRTAEHDTGVTLTDITFKEQQSQDETGEKSVTQNTAAQLNAALSTPAVNSKDKTSKDKKSSVLTEQPGHLTVTGDYKNVRQFIDTFSGMSRLISFDHWNLTTADKTLNFTLAAFRPEAPQLANEKNIVNRDPLLSNRVPLTGKNEYDAILNQIESNAKFFQTQHDKDMANLEIQQTQNRLLAGLMNQKEAVSILDQPYAGEFLPGANTNIREVLGYETSTPPQTSPNPTTLLGNSIQTINSTATYKTQVTLDIDFTIYYAPTAKGLLPAPNAITTYDPTERTNPVEMR